MMTSRLCVAAGIIAAAAGLCRGQVDEAAKSKIEQMAEAVKAARSLSYKVQFYGLGALAMLPNTQLEVVQRRDEEHHTWRTRIDGHRDEVTGPMGTPAVEIQYVDDGTL